MRLSPAMHGVRYGLLLLICATGAWAAVPADSQRGKTDAVESLVKAFCDAWNRHDGHALAAIMAQDVDFVNVGARWYHGRRDFETYHTRLLSGRFVESTTGALEIRTRFIRPDLAAIHWTWWIRADKNFDGTLRPQRFGLMTMLAEKHGDRWEVVVAQNTNLMAGAPAPEEEGITSPIPMPDAPAP